MVKEQLMRCTLRNPLIRSVPECSRVNGQGFGFVLPEEADKLREQNQNRKPHWIMISMKHNGVQKAAFMSATSIENVLDFVCDLDALIGIC